MQDWKVFFVSRTREYQAFFSWLLISGVLFQPVLTYLVTPTVVQDRQGFHTVVCTLKGEQKDVFVGLPSIDASKQAPDDCPAIKLVQLAGVACLPEMPAVSSSVLYSLGTFAQINRDSHHRIHYSAYSSRAPPLV
jgi:hypothetical protein